MGVVRHRKIKLKHHSRMEDHTIGVAQNRKNRLRVWLIECGWNIELMELVVDEELNKDILVGDQIETLNRMLGVLWDQVQMRFARSNYCLLLN